MADKSLVGVEGITPNPSQAAFTLENIDKFKTLNEANAAITDTNITNEAINRAFSNSPIWQKYLSDPNRFSNPDNLPLIQVERMYRQSLYQPIVEKYGDELLEINRNVQEFYRPSGRAEVIRRGYDFARYGLRVADARTKLSNAIKSGDESAIKIAQANLQAEEYRLAREGTEFESSTANAVASFVASTARTALPLLAVELGAAALSGGSSMLLSAGARATAVAAKAAKGAKAVRLAAKAAAEATQVAKEIKLARGAIRLITEGTKAAMVYDGTYRLEFGGALQELDQIAPYMSEEEKRKYAHAAAAPASAIESGLMLVGGGANYITRGIGKLTTRAAIKSGLPSELLTDANFIKEFMKGTKKGGLAKVVAGYMANNLAEAATEEIQNSMSRAAIELARQGKDPNLVLEWTAQDLYDFVTNLGQPSNAERERQFLDNMFASAIVSIPGGVARGASSRGRSVGTAMAGVRKNQTLADRLFHMMNNTKVGQESQKTVKDNLQNMVARGEAPSTVYLDKQSAQELIDTDPDVREAFEKLGVLQAIRESETNGGTVEIPLVEYNEVINGDSSGKLYQKVRAMVSFDNNLLSTAEFMRYIQTDANVQGEIAEAQKKADSVYNKTLEIMNTVENMDENTKKMNATIMQLITNRIAGFSIGSPKTAEEVFSKVDILTGQGQPTAENVLKQETKKVEWEKLQVDESTTYESYGRTFRVSNNFGNYELDLLDNKGKVVSSIVVKNGIVSNIETIKGKRRKGNATQVLLEAEKLFGKLKAHPELKRGAQAFWKYNDYVTPDESGYMTRKEHEGDTIEVDGVERTVYNSNGDKISTSTAGLTNFWRWFGDSKVVDSEGRPLVVYHGSDVSGIQVFDKEANQTKQRQIGAEEGYFFTDSKKVAERFRTAEQRKAESKYYTENTAREPVAEEKYDAQGRYIGSVHYVKTTLPEYKNFGLYGVYLKADSITEYGGEMIGVGEERAAALRSAKASGKDGVIIYNADTGAGIANEYIVFDESNIKSTENIGTFSPDSKNIYLQETGKGDEKVVAGWFEKQGDRLVINLTKAQNPTTFAHEAFHLFADSLIESYNADALSPYWKAQAEKMFKSAGVKLKDGKAKLTTAQQEKLANQFTTYILEGKVQNKELTPLFAYMKDLFAKVYRLLGLHKYKLDKNITSVFDSIFNSQAEIEAEQRILGMLEFEKPEGADQTLYDRYISFLLNSRSKASQKMVKAIFAYEAFKNSEEYKTRYAKEYADALAVLNDSMAYQIKALAATVDNDPALTFAMFSAQHPDAEITVDAIEEILKNTPDMTVEAERMANEAMNDVVLEKFGIDKETFASRALRNADKAKALLAEAMMREGKTWAEFEEEYSKLLRGVENQTARMTLSKIRNMNYWANQEARLVEQYAYYLATGDMKRAAEARRSQAALTLIRMKGEELDKRATRFKADFPDKMRFNQKKDTVSAQAWDLMQSILERYGFKITSKRRDPRPVNVKLEEWVADKEKTYFTTIGNMRYFIPAILEGHTGKFSEMQVRKFEEMEHVLKAINSLARDEFRITTEGESMMVRDLVEESIKRLDEKNIMPFEKTNSWWKTHFGVLGSWVNPEPVLEALFPERVMNKVFRPLFTAAAKAETQAQDWSNRWAAIKSKVDLSSNKVRYSNGVELKQYEVADLLLAMGTQHAYDNFLLKFEITDAQAQVVVAEALQAQPALEKFAKDTWALYAETTEVMNKSFMKRFNQLFVKKEHRKFTINGIEFEGGYVPENKGNVTLPENPDYHSIQMAMLGSEKLLVKEADGEVRSIVDNTDSRLYLFARWGYAAAEYNNVCKFLENETLQARLGDRGNRFIYDWLKGYQTPQTDASGMIRPLMTATSMSALGFRLSTALMQLSGFIPASQVVGMRWMVRAMRRNLTEIKMESAITKAANKSAYMKARYGNPISSMFGLEAKDISKTKWVREKYQKYAMVLISYVDAIIANATWDAAYLKATESKGLSREEAILEADAAVRVSQSDSMALSRSKALQSNWARLLTPFSTYIMGMQSLVRGRIAENERLTAATVALGYIVVATLYEAVLKEAVDDIWEDDEDDDKFVERVFQTWYNQALGTFGNTIMPAMSIGGSVVSRLAYGFEEALWDDDGEMVTKVYAPTVSAMNYYSQALSIIQNSIPAVAGDDEAQVKVMLNSIGLLSQRTKKIVKEWMNE